METALATRVANLEADRAALLILIVSLMQTHHAGELMHMRITINVELQLAGGSLGKLLDERQKHRVRELIEWLGAIRVAPPAPTAPSALPPLPAQP